MHLPQSGARTAALIALAACISLPIHAAAQTRGGTAGSSTATVRSEPTDNAARPVTEASASTESTSRPATPAKAATPADSAVARTYARHFGIAESLAHRIIRAARAEGIELGVAFGLVRVESNFREKAVGSGGALGFTQVLHGTARSMRPGISRDEVLDGDTNLRLGFHYLRGMLQDYDGNVREALFAYKYGPVNLRRLRRAGRDPGPYASMVLQHGDTSRVIGPGNRPFRRTRGN